MQQLLWHIKVCLTDVIFSEHAAVGRTTIMNWSDLRLMRSSMCVSTCINSFPVVTNQICLVVCSHAPALWLTNLTPAYFQFHTRLCSETSNSAKAPIVGEKRDGAPCRVKIRRIKTDLRCVNKSKKVIVDPHPAPDQHQNYSFLEGHRLLTPAMFGGRPLPRSWVILTWMTERTLT